MLTSALAPIDLQLGLEAADVARDLRPDVRVHARGHRSLVLADLRQDVCAQRHREARVEPLDDRADLLLVRRVDVRVDERDGQRLDPRADQVVHDLLDLRLVDRDDDVSARVEALDGLARVGEGRGRVGLDHDDPAGERARRLGAGQVEDLAEPLGRDQADARSLRLEHGVRRDGGAVENVLQLADLDAGLVADPADAGEDALGRVVGRRRRLDAELGAAVALGHEEEVGEGTPDIDPQPVRHVVLLLLAGNRRERAGLVDLTLELAPEL